MEIKLSTENFEKEVLKSEKPVLVDFYADWCGPCNAMAPVIEELAKELEGKVKVGKINVDENPEALENFSLVKDQTPALIMLDTSNNISAIEFKCSDKDKLKIDIDNALGK